MSRGLSNVPKVFSVYFCIGFQDSKLSISDSIILRIVSVFGVVFKALGNDMKTRVVYCK